MIKPQRFVSFLQSHGYDFFTGVPCSYFKDIINYIDAHSNAYFAAPNEGSALALANGAYLGGRGSVVMIQNSGLGNLINPLTSLSMIYKIPALIFVSGRAYGIPDEPQHEIMGARMGDLLKSLGIAFRNLPRDESFEAAISEALSYIQEKREPFVFFVHKDTFEKFQGPARQTKSAYPATRIEAIRELAAMAGPEDFIFATTGMISRELFSVHDRPGNFYMQGSMGHIGSVALGTALACPERRVIVFDGDGAFLMHMGTSSMIGFYQAKNFIHVVLDNESYETTGDQDTTSPTTDFAKIAGACSYKNARNAADLESLKKNFADLLKEDGPSFLRMKINRLETKNIPRITTRYHSSDITKNFQAAVKTGSKTSVIS